MRFGNNEGHYELNIFSGCSQIAISNHAFIRAEMRGQGKGQAQHLERLGVASKLGYDYLIATVISTNLAEKHILAKNGWKKLDGFMSSTTENQVEIWGRLVGQLTETHIQP